MKTSGRTTRDALGLRHSVMPLRLQRNLVQQLSLDVDAARREGSIVPTFLLPGIIGAQEAHHAWESWVRPYLDSPLPMDDRAVLLTAALERDHGRASILHATGLSLVGQPEEPVDLVAATERLMATREGRLLLEVTQRLGRYRTAPVEDLVAVRNQLGTRLEGWRYLLMMSAWADQLARLHLDRLHPTSDERLEPWLEQVVQVRAMLPPIS